MADSLEERLRSHAQAFDGLLSLIPAKYYYGEDTSDQWQRKKQTKEEARNAKKAKLDPDSSKSAKDVMEENARKRKRENENAQSDSEDGPLGSELPGEGLRNKSKKQKMDDADEMSKTNGAIQKKGPSSQDDDAETRKKNAEKRAEKRAEKKAAKQERKKLKSAENLKKKENTPQTSKTPRIPNDGKDKDGKEESKPADKAPAEDRDDSDEDMAPLQGFSVLEDNQEEAEPASTAPSSPNPHSQPFDPSNPPSGSSSISSLAPPSDHPAPKDDKQDSSAKPARPTSEELKQRLQKRLDELRAARHADGLNGKPAKNRQELIEARRQKEEQRRAHKKEMRQKAKEDEQRRNDEAIAKRFSPRSGSLLNSPGSPAESITSIPNNFSFGRVMFADGQQTDSGLSALLERRKAKGSQDPASALKAAEAKKLRLSNLDEEKRADIAEKDMWLNAKRRAHGERVRDDTSLLKKTLNRKANAKKKSEREWKDRLEGVTKGKEMRQAKREENIRKRKEERGSKGKKGKGKGKARPGFEGKRK